MLHRPYSQSSHRSCKQRYHTPHLQMGLREVTGRPKVTQLEMAAAGSEVWGPQPSALKSSSYMQEGLLDFQSPNMRWIMVEIMYLGYWAGNYGKCFPSRSFKDVSLLIIGLSNWKHAGPVPLYVYRKSDVLVNLHLEILQLTVSVQTQCHRPCIFNHRHHSSLFYQRLCQWRDGWNKVIKG